MRPPPRSTLFPTRRSSDLCHRPALRVLVTDCRSDDCLGVVELTISPNEVRVGEMVSSTTPRQRSEEHTSELQSHSDLVCRLLLEKKKDKKDITLCSSQIYS